MKSLKVPVIIFDRASDANEEYVGQLTTPVGWGKNADSAGGITPDLNVREAPPKHAILKGPSTSLDLC